MSILLQGAKFSNQILPQEKCPIRNNFGVFSKLSLLKMFFQTFYPNLQTFLQGLIPKIPDILQLLITYGDRINYEAEISTTYLK